ncbi:MAG: Nif3-like dinuclear metal center hexameric protein [Proteobacteria bacterium]|nr:MAG: Nif3-like dinuclear metal center hexameric protein [Pseudomonadota bacterium]
MTLKQIYELLDAISPFELQEGWDNSGVQIGKDDDEIAKIYLSLDIDRALLENVKPNSLIITHHPLIFKGLKSFNPSLYPASLLQIMVQKNISQIAMHTNFDKTHLNKFVAKNILGLEVLKSEDFCLHLKVEKSFEDFCQDVKKALKMEYLRVVEAKDYIKTAVLTTGSGGDFISKIKSDCFLTGDLKYHQALEAKENNLSLIDIGHYESECHFTAALSEELQKIKLKVIMSNSFNPFKYK